MNIIQAAAAVYILVLFAAGVVGVLYHAWTGKSWNASINGLPGVMFMVATAICAVSTIVGLE